MKRYVAIMILIALCAWLAFHHVRLQDELKEAKKRKGHTSIFKDPAQRQRIVKQVDAEKRRRETDPEYRARLDKAKRRQWERSALNHNRNDNEGKLAS